MKFVNGRMENWGTGGVEQATTSLDPMIPARRVLPADRGPLGVLFPRLHELLDDDSLLGHLAAGRAGFCKLPFGNNGGGLDAGRE